MECADLTQARGKTCIQRGCEGLNVSGGIVEALNYFWVESCKFCRMLMPEIQLRFRLNVGYEGDPGYEGLQALQTNLVYALDSSVLRRDFPVITYVICSPY